MGGCLDLQVKSNIEEVRARGGEVIVITNAQNDDLKVAVWQRWQEPPCLLAPFFCCPISHSAVRLENVVRRNMAARDSWAISKALQTAAHVAAV